jgi:hypothetical protein
MTLITKPAPRWSAVMAELPTSDELILFGGKTTSLLYNGITSYSGILNDTWSFNGTSFTNISTGISGNTLTNPLPRYEMVASYDGYFVTMVGGTDGISNLSSVWSYSASLGWFEQNLTNTVSLTPPPLYSIPTQLRGASMAYMSSKNEAILFGGQSSTQRHYSLDTWAWVSNDSNTGSWTYLSPANSPNSRTYASMASSSTTAVLFGGKDFSGPLSDTWIWNGTNWSQVVTGQTPGTSSPCARYGANFSYDANDGVFVLQGGISSPGLFSNTSGFCQDSWYFSTISNSWTQITGPQPPARAFAASAYLTATTSVYLFGGLNSLTDLSDLWSYSSSAGWVLVG